MGCEISLTKHDHTICVEFLCEFLSGDIRVSFDPLVHLVHTFSGPRWWPAWWVTWLCSLPVFKATDDILNCRLGYANFLCDAAVWLTLPIEINDLDLFPVRCVWATLSLDFSLCSHNDVFATQDTCCKVCHSFYVLHAALHDVTPWILREKSRTMQVSGSICQDPY